jgi:competence protein ComGC
MVFDLLIFLFVLMIIGIVVFLIIKSKKWHCTEKGCEQIFGGQFQTQKECSDRCKEKQSSVESYRATTLSYMCDENGCHS